MLVSVSLLSLSLIATAVASQGARVSVLGRESRSVIHVEREINSCVRVECEINPKFRYS